MCSEDFCSRPDKVIQDCQSAQTPDQTNIKRYQIWLHKEFDRTVVNKTGEGLLMMMMVKKCIWNVQPDAAAHFFPSTQSMNHRADENAPRRCTRFFLLLTIPCIMMNFFWASQCSAHTQWSEGLSTGFVLLSHTINLWLKAHLIYVVLAISILIRNDVECWPISYCSANVFCLFFDFLSVLWSLFLIFHFFDGRFLNSFYKKY